MNNTNLSAETLMREAQAGAGRVCQLALEQTPRAYQSFIVLIEQRKKVAGTRSNPIYAQVKLPYMTVDGRVKMAIDEHRQANKRLEIKTEFVTDAATKQLLARATVISELGGTAIAHARVFIGGDGPHETNPLETAETSAVGRALGFLGYGCFGTGIAAADEILRVQTAESGTDRSVTVAAPGRVAPSGSNGNPTDPNAGLAPGIAPLVTQLDLHPGELDLLRAQAPDDAALLDRLQTMAREIPNDLLSRKAERGQLTMYANQLGLSITAYEAYLEKKYGVQHAGELTEDQLAEEQVRFVRRYRDPAIAGKFRAQCRRVADSKASASSSDAPDTLGRL